MAMNRLYLRLHTLTAVTLNTLFQKFCNSHLIDSFKNFSHEFRFSFFQYKNSYFSALGITYKIEMIESNLIEKMYPSSAEHFNF